MDDGDYGDAKKEIDAALRPQIRRGMSNYAKVRQGMRKNYRTRFSSETLKEKGVSVDATGSFATINDDKVLETLQGVVPTANEILSARVGNPTSLEVLNEYYNDLTNISHDGDSYLLLNSNTLYINKSETAGMYSVLEPYYDTGAELNKWRALDTVLDTAARYATVEYTLEKRIPDTVNNWFDDNGYNRVNSSVFIEEGTETYEYAIDYNPTRVGNQYTVEISRIDDQLNIITLIFGVPVIVVDLTYDPDIRVSYGKIDGYKSVTSVNNNALKYGTTINYELVIPTSELPTATNCGVYCLNPVIAGDVYYKVDYLVVSIQYLMAASTHKRLHIFEYSSITDMGDLTSATAIELSPIIPLKLNF